MPPSQWALVDTESSASSDSFALSWVRMLSSCKELGSWQRSSECENRRTRFGNRIFSGKSKSVEDGEGVQGGTEHGNRNKDRVNKWIPLLFHLELFLLLYHICWFLFVCFPTLVDGFILFPHLPPTPTTSSGPSSSFPLAFMTPSSIIIFGM